MDTESIQIHLNSKNANSYNNGSLSDCMFILPYFDIPSQHSIYLSVVHAVIPYSFYNIDSSNNFLSYSENGGISVNIFITAGNYTAIQMASYLTSIMTRFTVGYNGVTNKFTFTNSTYDFIINSNSTCLDMLGFSSTEASFLSSASRILTSEYCVNMAQKQCLCIGSNLQTGNINLSSVQQNYRSIICSIPLDGQPFSLIAYKNPNNYKVNLYSNNLSVVNIKLLDQNGNLIDLNGKYFSLTLQLDIINFVE
jgi:hypothetical protein